jgi:hypothetical protein
VFVALHGPAFATRLVFVAPPDVRLVLVIKDVRDLHEAVKQLAVVGYDQVLCLMIEAWDCSRRSPIVELTSLWNMEK